MFYVVAVNQKTANAVDFGPYRTEAEATAAANAGRRRGGRIRWWVMPLEAPAEGGDESGTFVVDVIGETSCRDPMVGPFLTSAAARAWIRKQNKNTENKRLDCRVSKLKSGVDKEVARFLWLPEACPRRRTWV